MAVHPVLNVFDLVEGQGIIKLDYICHCKSNCQYCLCKTILYLDGGIVLEEEEEVVVVCGVSGWDCPLLVLFVCGVSDWGWILSVVFVCGISDWGCPLSVLFVCGVSVWRCPMLVLSVYSGGGVVLY